MSSKELRIAMVVGSTGLVGSSLIQQLSVLDRFQQVVAVSRKAVSGLPTKIENRVVDFDDHDQLAKVLKGATDLFFCFGTTLKNAGSKEKFVEIEWGLSKKILEIAAEDQVTNLYLVSAMGANSNSSILYSRIKGQIEDLAKHLSFKSVQVLRPSLLLGKRKEVRIGELIAKKVSNKFSFMFVGPLLEYKAINAELVAQRLVELSGEPRPGFHIYKNDELHSGWIEIEA